MHSTNCSGEIVCWSEEVVSWGWEAFCWHGEVLNWSGEGVLEWTGAMYVGVLERTGGMYVGVLKWTGVSILMWDCGPFCDEARRWRTGCGRVKVADLL